MLGMVSGCFSIWLITTVVQLINSPCCNSYILDMGKKTAAQKFIELLLMAIAVMGNVRYIM